MEPRTAYVTRQHACVQGLAGLPPRRARAREYRQADPAARAKARHSMLARRGPGAGSVEHGVASAGAGLRPDKVMRQQVTVAFLGMPGIQVGLPAPAHDLFTLGAVALGTGYVRRLRSRSDSPIESAWGQPSDTSTPAMSQRGEVTDTLDNAFAERITGSKTLRFVLNASGAPNVAQQTTSGSVVRSPAVPGGPRHPVPVRSLVDCRPRRKHAARRLPGYTGANYVEPGVRNVVNKRCTFLSAVMRGAHQQPPLCQSSRLCPGNQ
jgi:hypothetical protein